jgi:hypothetical protein
MPTMYFSNFSNTTSGVKMQTSWPGTCHHMYLLLLVVVTSLYIVQVQHNATQFRTFSNYTAPKLPVFVSQYDQLQHSIEKAHKTIQGKTTNLSQLPLSPLISQSDPTTPTTTITIRPSIAPMPPFAEITMLTRADSSSSLLSTDSQHVKHNDVKTKPQHHHSVVDADDDVDDQRPIITSTRKSSSVAKKSVRFNDYDEVVEIKHVSNFSRRQIAATWWSKEERNEFRQNSLKLIRDAETDSASLTRTDDDFRGLDQHTKEYSEQCRSNVDRIYDIVYECQSFEDAQGVPVPPQVLADYLFEVSQHTVLAAQVRAIQDEVMACRCQL